MNRPDDDVDHSGDRPPDRTDARPPDRTDARPPAGEPQDVDRPLVGPRSARVRGQRSFRGPAPLARPLPGTGLRSTAGPLVARRDPVGRRRSSPAGSAGSPGGWAWFSARWGWRAYAVPVLALLTVLVLVDVAVPREKAPRSPSGTGAAAVSRAAPGLERTTTDAPTPTPTPTPAPAEGEADPDDAELTEPAGYVEVGAGTLSVVDGTSQVYGTGPLERFVVEVEDNVGVDGARFAAAVESTLGDPRSWGHEGAYSFQRVGEVEAAAGDYDFRVSLVSPGSMETYCPGVGTGGYTSCRYGERAVINLARWETAVPDYNGDIPTYRQYVVNHEVGHALGNGHQPCPGAGQLAPVMQQQTLGLEGCLANAWPFP